MIPCLNVSLQILVKFQENIFQVINNGVVLENNLSVFSFKE